MKLTPALILFAFILGCGAPGRGAEDAASEPKAPAADGPPASSKLDETMARIVAAVVAKPENTSFAMTVAAVQVWHGRDADHAASVQRMLAWAPNATKPEDLERAAKAACLRPIADPAQQDTALTLARKAVDLGKDDKAFVPWSQMTLGMAQYRKGLCSEAEQTLLTFKNGGGQIGGTAGYFLAMSLFQQGKTDDAHRVFATVLDRMRPLPFSDMRPLGSGVDADDLIVWLAYKEAKALMKEPGEAPRSLQTKSEKARQASQAKHAAWMALSPEEQARERARSEAARPQAAKDARDPALGEAYAELPEEAKAEWGARLRDKDLDNKIRSAPTLQQRHALYEQLMKQIQAKYGVKGPRDQ